MKFNYFTRKMFIVHYSSTSVIRSIKCKKFKSRLKKFIHRLSLKY